MKRQLNDMSELDTIAKEGGLPYLLKFGNESCGPCHAMKPVLTKLSEDNPDFNVFEVDTHKNPEIAELFGIRSVPSLFFCEQREVLYSLVGSTPLGKLQYIINNINDPYFREHGKFEAEDSKEGDKSFKLIIGTIVVILLAALVFVR